jgi:hypothetical protein
MNPPVGEGSPRAHAERDGAAAAPAAAAGGGGGAPPRAPREPPRAHGAPADAADGAACSTSGRPACFVIVYNVSKKHNIGTLLRSCTAFGVTQVGRRRAWRGVAAAAARRRGRAAAAAPPPPFA